LASQSQQQDRLRLLVVMALPLYPANTGGRLRSSKILEHLSLAHHVTVLCFARHDTQPGELDQMRACCARLETVPWREARKYSTRFYLELALALCSRLPYTVWKYRSRVMRSAIQNLLQADRYDLLLCDFLQPAINCLDVPFRPKVLWQHNVEAVVMERQAANEVNPLARAYLRIEAGRLRRFEKNAARAFDHCVMVSDQDCRTMAARYDVRHTSSIPTGVDLQYLRPEPEESGTSEVVFVGSMDWLPNQDAAFYFVREILPHIRKVMPVTFVIVGRNPPVTIRRLEAGGSVRVSGTVPDVRPYLARAQVCVVPLRSGGGTRIKIFEAMAMAKAVVSTPVGAEGLPVTPGLDIIVREDPEAFAAAVVDLLRNPQERRRLGEAGYQLVRGKYGWEAAAKCLSDICLEVAQQAKKDTLGAPV
jgi:polysaccharide biosynthesis protein PslH